MPYDVAAGTTVAETQRVVTSYLFACAAVIPLTGWASHRFGTRRMWMFAVEVFMLGSMGASSSPVAW